MDSLEVNGQRKPVVIYSDMIVAGNGTVEAAKRLGWNKVWVNDDPFASLEHAKAYAVADNRSAELADWDNQTLFDTLNDLKDSGWDLENVGFTDEEMKKLLKQDDDKEVNSDEIKEFCIFISCKTEAELSDLFDEMTSRGFEVKLT
jgi:site-specific DNA-methyltransferase (adenine-specific)